MLTTQQQVYNQHVQKDYVEHIQFTKEVEQMATKQKSSKKSQPAVSEEAKESKSSKKSDGFKEQKKDYVEKLVAFAKEEFSELSDTKLRSVLSGGYFAFNEEIKNKK